MRYNSAMGILGSVVLIDEDGDPYKSSGPITPTAKNFGLGLLGGVVLIDPFTGNPYSLEGE